VPKIPCFPGALPEQRLCLHVIAHDFRLPVATGANLLFPFRKIIANDRKIYSQKI
jgi:hypothetical protein